MKKQAEKAEGTSCPKPHSRGERPNCQLECTLAKLPRRLGGSPALVHAPILEICEVHSASLPDQPHASASQRNQRCPPDLVCWTSGSHLPSPGLQGSPPFPGADGVLRLWGIPFLLTTEEEPAVASQCHLSPPTWSARQRCWRPGALRPFPVGTWLRLAWDLGGFGDLEPGEIT